MARVTRAAALLLVIVLMLFAAVSCSRQAFVPPPEDGAQLPPGDITGGDGGDGGQDGTGDDGGQDGTGDTGGGEPVQLSPVGSGFDATYNESEIRLPASYAGPPLDLPIDLGAVAFLDAYDLTEAQLALLSEQGFVVTPDTYREFDTIYDYQLSFKRPAFVTLDSALHVYHLVFAKILRDLEDERFYPAISQLSSALENAAAEQYTEAQGTSLEEAAKFAWAYFAVAEQLILQGPTTLPPPISDVVQQEVGLIEAHAGFANSPLLSVDKPYKEDYSQYKPRGHYTRTEQRQRYFRTMMWYGRMNFRLQVPAETQMALLITLLCQQATVGQEGACAVWAGVYDPTAFLVGNADDLGIREYTQVMRQVYGEQVDLAALADPDLLAQFIAAARELPPPQINSMLYELGEDPVEATQGFRFMGQRFVLDGWIICELTHPSISGRIRVSGLDVCAGLGNPEAYLIQEAAGVPATYPQYDSQLAMIKDRLAGLTQADWTQNVYFGWLYVLQGAMSAKDEDYPPFMRTQPWARKDLQAVLGSWAELKHDTILYAKQPVFGYTGFPGLPDVEAVNYLEPNPVAYARLAGLARLTREGLESRELLTYDATRLLEIVTPHLQDFQFIAEKELAGLPLAAGEIELLGYHSAWLEHILELSADEADEESDRAALIADVATDPNRQMVLEVGTGAVYSIYVVTPGDGGVLQLARGAVYSFYEFWQPLSDRLTDEQWREMLDDGTQPPQPDWTTTFICD